MSKYRFYLELDELERIHKWYIDLPEYIEAGGSKEELQMILGADEFLYTLAEGSHEVYLNISLDENDRFENAFGTLRRTDNVLDSGSYYIFDGPLLQVLWLCDVTLFIFNNKFPDNIYFKRVTP